MHLYLTTFLGIISVAAGLKCNIKCNRMLAPVCGHDGRTYSNECTARYSSCQTRQAITIVAQTECKKIGVNLAGPMACTADYRPVCGSDGKTYANKCQLISAAATSGQAISVVQESSCDDVGDACALKCTREMKPVCGSDRKQHANECHMRSVACATKKAIIAVSDGSRTSCKTCRFPCTRVYRPVCGSNGVTYGNECVMKGAACMYGTIIKINDGECKFNRDCKIACPRNLSPVCGSDGKKYSNECLLKVAACKQGKAISVVQERAFDADCSKCNFACTREYNPVCGSDGKTHPTECVMRGAACRSGKAINKVYDGECK